MCSFVVKNLFFISHVITTFYHKNFGAPSRNDKGILQSNTRRRLLSQYEARSATGADGGFGAVCTVAYPSRWYQWHNWKFNHKRKQKETKEIIFHLEN